MERREKFETGEIYHVYNRGVEKRILFQTPNDYKRFLALLYIANDTKETHLSNLLNNGNIEKVFEKTREQPLVAIGAYCLMPNHFHILITPLVNGGLSKFMQKVQTGYSMYFNKKHSRVGSLFQGTFKSKYINKNEYLMYIYSYIHLNPAKIKNKEWKIQPTSFIQNLEDFISTYPFSSLREYLSKKHVLINPEHFPISNEQICDYYSMLSDFSEAFFPGNTQNK